MGPSGTQDQPLLIIHFAMALADGFLPGGFSYRFKPPLRPKTSGCSLEVSVHKASYAGIERNRSRSDSAVDVAQQFSRSEDELSSVHLCPITPAKYAPQEFCTSYFSGSESGPSLGLIRGNFYTGRELLKSLRDRRSFRVRFCQFGSLQAPRWAVVRKSGRFKLVGESSPPP